MAPRLLPMLADVASQASATATRTVPSSDRANSVFMDDVHLISVNGETERRLTTGLEAVVGID